MTDGGDPDRLTPEEADPVVRLFAFGRWVVVALLIVVTISMVIAGARSWFFWRSLVAFALVSGALRFAKHFMIQAATTAAFDAVPPEDAGVYVRDEQATGPSLWSVAPLLLAVSILAGTFWYGLGAIIGALT